MTGLPRSSGSVALLDGGEERVEVDVEDRPGAVLTRGILAVACHRAGTTARESKPPGAATGRAVDRTVGRQPLGSTTIVTSGVMPA